MHIHIHIVYVILLIPSFTIIIFTHHLSSTCTHFHSVSEYWFTHRKPLHYFPTNPLFFTHSSLHCYSNEWTITSWWGLVTSSPYMVLLFVHVYLHVHISCIGMTHSCNLKETNVQLMQLMQLMQIPKEHENMQVLVWLIL